MNAALRRITWLIAAAALIWGGEAIHAHLNGYYQDILQRCGIAIIMAVSLNIVNGLTGQFAIGHAGFMAVGAYTGAGISYQVGAHFTHGAAPTLSLMLLAMCGGGALSALFGYAVGVPSLRLRGDYLAIVTLGFGEIIRVLLENTDEIAPGLHLGGATGMADAPQLVHSTLLFPLILGTAVVVIVLARNLKFSSHGLAFLSVREDEVAADAMGVNTTNIKVSAFVLSACFAGVGGAIYAHSYFISPAVFNFILSMNFVVMIVMGGTGSITGATMAAVAVTLLPEMLKPVRDKFHFDDVYIQVVFALSLVILMIVRPSGVFGTGEIGIRNKEANRHMLIGGLWLLVGALIMVLTTSKTPAHDVLFVVAYCAIVYGGLRIVFGAIKSSTDSNRGESATGNVEHERRESDQASDYSSDRELGRAVVLDATDLTRLFGGLTAVGNVNIKLEQGELVGLIGPNGAGKTTFFNLLTGVYEPSGGTLNFLGKSLAGVLPNPALKRTLRLVWDGVLFVTGGWVIGTIMSTVLTPYATSASDLRIQAVVKWGCIIAGLFAAIITAPRRRRFAPGLKPHQFAARGISRTFQNIRLFGELTVLENVRIGAYLRRRTNLLDGLFHTPRLQHEEAQNIEHARSLLSRFNLTRFESELAKNLPYGDQRRLEIVRALATEPKLLLLDEPAAGMNPQEKAGLMSLIRQIRDDFGLTILLIEHDMALVMGICERIYVLDYGVIIAHGTPEEIRSNPKVIAAYLGEDTEEEAGSAPDADNPGPPEGSPAAI